MAGYMPVIPKGKQMMAHPENLWFKQTFAARWRVKIDECGDPFIPLRASAGHIFAYKTGELGVWLNGTKRPHGMAKQFPDLKLRQHADEEHIFSWPFDHPDTQKLLSACGCRRRAVPDPAKVGVQPVGLIRWQKSTQGTAKQENAV